jgi:hypothetical protein
MVILLDRSLSIGGIDCIVTLNVSKRQPYVRHGGGTYYKENTHKSLPARRRKHHGVVGGKRNTFNIFLKTGPSWTAYPRKQSTDGTRSCQMSRIINGPEETMKSHQPRARGAAQLPMRKYSYFIKTKNESWLKKYVSHSVGPLSCSE